METTVVCIACSKTFVFGDGCFEFDDGDMCAECYAAYCAQDAEYSESAAVLDDYLEE